MTRILVPVDFSKTSSNALSYAVELFGSSSLEVTVLHVFSTIPTTMAMKNIEDVIEKDSRRDMEAFVKRTQKTYPELTLKSIVLNDHAVSAISALGNSGEFDFIVMGTKGASGLKEVFLGSVAGGVIAKTEAPVIVVPTDYRYSPLNEIVVALSDTPLSGREVADPLRELVRIQKSKVKVLHISEKEDESMEAALEDFNDLNPTVEYAFGPGNTNQQLSDYLDHHDSGMLCLIRCKKKFIRRFLEPSVTLKQTFESPVPLLILHDMNPVHAEKGMATFKSEAFPDHR